MNIIKLISSKIFFFNPLHLGHFEHVLIKIGFRQSLGFESLVLQVVFKGVFSRLKRKQKEVKAKHSTNADELDYIEHWCRKQIDHISIRNGGFYNLRDKCEEHISS